MQGFFIRRKNLSLFLSIPIILFIILGNAPAQELDAKRIKSIRDQSSPEQARVPVSNPDDSKGANQDDAGKDLLNRLDNLETRVDRLENRNHKFENNDARTTEGEAGAGPESPARASRGEANRPEKNRPLRGKARLDSFATSCLGGCTVDNIEVINQITQNLLPGSIITLAPGVYKPTHSIKLQGGGSDTDTRPLTLRAEKLGTVRIESNIMVAIRIQHPNWIIENLELVGTCKHDDFCEHAFQLVGPVSHTIIRNNRMRDFNSPIKSGEKDGQFANDVTIEGNHIFNAAARDTNLPVTQIDVNGGKRWKIIDNFIADFSKGGGDHNSYAGFLKSNSSDGVFARNLVICEWRHKGGTRVGLSFGGGGTTNPKFCEQGDCSIFHTGGLMVNNIIMNCPDVGIYLNRSKNTKVYNNTLINTTGIDARFDVTTADVENNIVLGKIRERDGGSVVEKNNIVDGLFSSAVEFTNPDKGDLSVKAGGDLLMKGALPPEVTTDFCGNPRTPNSATIGAIAYGSGKCDVSARIRRALDGLKE